MEYRMTRHAEDELVRRAIPRRLVHETIRGPQQIVPAHGGKKAYQSQFDFGQGRIYLLRVIVADAEDMPVVITAYRTSKISKYWRSP